MAPRRRGGTPKRNLMFCGKHVRPAHIPEEPRDATQTLNRLKPEDRYCRNLKSEEVRGSCICDYNDFAVLREEKQSTHKNSTTPTKPFRFRDMAPELRNKVFEHAFSLDEAIDFCPEPCLFSGGNIDGKNDSPEWLTNYSDHVTEHHIDYIKTNLSPFIGLLRVSKQISEEASGYLYSGNEFRFSNVSGWHTLNHFLHQIGLKKCAMLRRLTVAHPTYFIAPFSLTVDRGSFPISYLHVHVGRIYEDGFHYSARWFEDEKTLTTSDPALILEKAGQLRHLRITIPVGVEEKFAGSLVDASRFESLTVTVSQLLTEKDYESRWHPMRDTRHTRTGRDSDIAHSIVEEHFGVTGEQWRHERHFVDDYGRYPMITETGTVGAGEEEQEENETRAENAA